MAYTAKDYARLIGMAGFSESLLKNHFTLYQGYVTNTNKVLDILEQMLKEGNASRLRAVALQRAKSRPPHDVSQQPARQNGCKLSFSNPLVPQPDIRKMLT